MLTIKDLSVKFPTRFGDFTAIEDVDMTIKPGEIHGLVGESGAGKSTVGAAVIGLLQSPGYVANGTLTLGDTDLRNLSPAEAHKVRGGRISMIFQDPQTSLNPLMTIERQLIETIQTHSTVSESEARNRAVDLLEEIGIKNATERIKAYPHQFSGGMRQRVVIALAISTDPELVIADEPTTALDVAVQSQVLDLIQRLAKERQIAFMLITHDIGVIAQVADRVTVMRKGRVMETGVTAQVLGKPQHHYTQQLMDSVPPLDRKIDRFRVPEADNTIASNGAMAENWLLEGSQHARTGLSLTGLSVKFAGPRTSIFRKPPPYVALDDVTLNIKPGSIMGLVGESGSGKSTLAKAITGLVTPSSGTMELGDDVLPYGKSRSRQHPSRQLTQMVFQDPYSSLNSRHRIGDILTEPLWFYGFVKDEQEREKLAASMLSLVGMQPDAISKYPHQFSGGQRQRIAVARALLARPRFLICDEPTSALDVSIQAEILNLLKDLQAKFGLTILFISHNLAVVRQMADDTAVLRSGKIEEVGETNALYTAPQADYTKSLLDLTPVMPTTWQT
ncbi:MAG TPA: ABC transporter ATP-binding protein [Rhodobacteraceae bacterium]|jgi:peptide/nickel transport system ATP-binding protein|uniref:dipeptide ABC transporter ATP-binding protein n=1 Tax=Planktotalea sp. TaxID=2029877 RepID=UPI000183A2D9|nr:ABC transporter ATP-binding protein [Planktotalea sp.]EDZ42543.1 ABC transporter, ATP-binding protein [Rhodobacteraceae bacterium HTCC2083]MDG1084292.1 ABC transporter ATP-binding protein [Planktotalea sp.]HCW83507.1 ABC transporter ATP-binding protein [Paracoccaceae bacterium]